MARSRAQIAAVKAKAKGLEVAVADELTERQKKFCREYVKDFNGSAALIRAGYSENGAHVAASRLLANVTIKNYVIQIQKESNIMETLTRERIIEEHKKIAFSSIAHLHKTWIELKEFEKLTDEQKEAIQEITTSTFKGKKMVKIKLYDKQKSMDAINRMLGYDAPTVIKNINPATQALQVNVYSSGPPMADSETALEVKRNGKEDEKEE